MKLYYSPGACSLADRIALAEAGLPCEFERVNLKTKKTEFGVDFISINPKGYVPALILDSGDTVTENIAVLSWISEQACDLMPTGSLGRARLLEALAYISTEIHKGFKPFFIVDVGLADKAKAGEMLTKRFELLVHGLGGQFLLGSRFTVADAYLFVMLLWAIEKGVALPVPLLDYFERIAMRESVRSSLGAEGLAFVLNEGHRQARVVA
jgi:glutathione S-transferase